jgi:Tol biopolymer transport system component
LFTADDAPGPIRTLYQYDFDTSAKHELLRANVRNPFWAPDDKKIAFLKWDNSAWSLWTMSPDNPQAGTNIFTREGLELYGWSDDHTLLGSNFEGLLWISDDGNIQQQLPFQEILGSGYHLARIDDARVNPANPDILLISFWYVPPAGELPLDKHEGNSPALLMYEIKSKRRVVLTPVGTWAESAEWSRDGLQIFFTGTDSSKHAATYRMFWDGTSLQKFAAGTGLVVGQ